MAGSDLTHMRSNRFCTSNDVKNSVLPILLETRSSIYLSLHVQESCRKLRNSVLQRKFVSSPSAFLRMSFNEIVEPMKRNAFKALNQ